MQEKTATADLVAPPSSVNADEIHNIVGLDGARDALATRLGRPDISCAVIKRAMASGALEYRLIAGRRSYSLAGLARWLS